MARLVIDTARGGTLCVGGVVFQKGSTPIDEARVRLEDAERACEGLRWANVVHDEPELPSEPGALPDADDAGPDAPEAALPVPGERDVAAEEVDGHLATRGDRLAELVAHDGEPPREKASDGHACPVEGCGKVLKSESGLRQHIQLKHPEG